MAKYEKRNVKKIRPERPTEKVAKPKRIEMKPEKSVKLPKKVSKPALQKPAKESVPAQKKQRERRFSVIKGYKDLNRTKTIIWVSGVLVVIALFILAAAMTPTGIVEYVSNTVAAMEKGAGFPQKLSGDDIVHAETNGKISYVLSETFLETFNSSGYNLLNDQHGFSNPVLKTSAARALVFDRGGTGCKIYNYKECLAEHTLSDKIIAAHIGRDGSTAFVLNSSEYASRVEVYNKDFVRQYSWNAASEIISSVALADNGSKIAVATFKSVNGEYLSSVYIFDFKSASPIFSKQISGEVVLSLYSDSGAIWAVTASGASRISWKDHSVVEHKPSGGVNIVSHSNKNMAFAGPAANNSLDTSVVLFNKMGEQLCSVVASGEADDICLGKKHIYLLINDSVYSYDFSGALVGKTEVGYDVKYLVELSGGTFGAVSTENITSYNIK